MNLILITDVNRPVEIHETDEGIYVKCKSCGKVNFVNNPIERNKKYNFDCCEIKPWVQNGISGWETSVWADKANSTPLEDMKKLFEEIYLKDTNFITIEEWLKEVNSKEPIVIYHPEQIKNMKL